MQTPIGRLKRRSEFLRVADAGRKWATPGLVLQVLRRASGNLRELEDSDESSIEPRVGYTASRKVGSAVARNRARRRLRAAAAEVLPAHAKPGRDFVLIARKGTLTRPFNQLLNDLKVSLKRLNAYQEGEKKP